MSTTEALQREAFDKLHPKNDEVPGILRESFFFLFSKGWEAALAATSAPENLGAMECRGNTVSYMYDRAKVYGDEIMRCWFVLKDAGKHPGRTDDKLHEVLRKALATSVPSEPAFYGFVNEAECRVDMCFTPSAPRADGVYATAFYTSPPPVPAVPQPDPAMQAINASANRMRDGIENLRTNDVSDLDPDLLALAELVTCAQPEAPAEPSEPVCPACNGEGTIRAMTSHLGPDDYEYDEQCAACNGTGSPDLKDAIEGVGYIRHPQFPARLYISREEVMKIVEARATLAKSKEKAS